MLNSNPNPSFFTGLSVKIEDSITRLQELRTMWLPMNDNPLLNSFDDHVLRDIGLERQAQGRGETPAENFARIAAERRAMSIGMTGL